MAVDTTFIPLPRTPFNPKLFHPKSPNESRVEVSGHMRFHTPHC